MNRLQQMCKPNSKAVMTAQLLLLALNMEKHLPVKFNFQNLCEVKLEFPNKQFYLKLNLLDKEIYAFDNQNNLVRRLESVSDLRKWIINGCRK